MKHTIRRTMVVLGAGVVVQRLCQLAGFLLAGRALGVEGLGVYAQGLAMAAMLAVVASAGVRNLVARALAARPDATRHLVLAAVRRRLVAGIGLGAPVAAVAFLVADSPWFWLLCTLQVVPAAFDLKNLLDAAGNARREVAIETAVAVLQLLAVAIWFALGGNSPLVLAAIALGGRSLYALGAIPAIAGLRGRQAPEAGGTRGTLAFATAQTAHELLTIGDVWLVALVLGDAAAGYYAFAVRFAAAALVPSGQLARLLLPHHLHAGAGADRDAAKTLATALRATAMATLPMLAGGLVVASGLCRWSAPPFAAAGTALQLLLLAGCLQHLGWQCSHALLARHRDRAFTHGLLWPALLHGVLLGVAGAMPAAGGADAAIRAALAAAIAQGLYCLGGAIATRTLRARSPVAWRAPLTIAGATAAVAYGAGCLPVAAPAALGLQLLGGGVTFAAGLWSVELRGRWRRVGDGLAAASGFRA